MERQSTNSKKPAKRAIIPIGEYSDNTPLEIGEGVDLS